jgi:hypothetical protein
MAALPNEINNRPMLLTALEMVERHGYHGFHDVPFLIKEGSAARSPFLTETNSDFYTPKAVTE